MEFNAEKLFASSQIQNIKVVFALENLWKKNPIERKLFLSTQWLEEHFSFILLFHLVLFLCESIASLAPFHSVLSFFVNFFVATYFLRDHFSSISFHRFSISKYFLLRTYCGA